MGFLRASDSGLHEQSDADEKAHRPRLKLHVNSYLVFEKNLIRCEEDVEFHSLAMDVHPLVCPDLL